MKFITNQLWNYGLKKWWRQVLPFLEKTESMETVFLHFDYCVLGRKSALSNHRLSRFRNGELAKQPRPHLKIFFFLSFILLCRVRWCSWFYWEGTCDGLYENFASSSLFLKFSMGRLIFFSKQWSWNSTLRAIKVSQK